MSVLSRSALESSPLADLHAIASELGIDGFRRLRKAQLVDAILAHQGSEVGDSGSPPEPAEAEVEVEVEAEGEPDVPEADLAEVEAEPEAPARPARARRSRSRKESQPE